MKLIAALLLIMLSTFTAAHAAKELAVTIDDLPFLYGRFLPDTVESQRFLDILATLKKHKVQVIGFVGGSHINGKTRPLLDSFLLDGHLVGNHTFTHADLNNVSAKWYENEIALCRKATSPWTGTVQYFRYPFLHEGSTKAKYQAVAKFLDDNSLVNVPVTIDNDDWLFNKNYTTALTAGNKAKADSIGRAYLDHMQEKTRYFDSVAHTIFHRDIKHILLIHMTELNADYLDKLLSWYEHQGWTFIPPAEALTDDIYQKQDTYIGKNGISWLLRF
jgi:peptidoglycan/xylan/chitin deacetylase (PgdA/CDA1 family)